MLFSCGNKKKESKPAEPQSTVQAESPDTAKYYNIEQGSVEYDVKAMENKGHLTVYWKDFGRVSYTTGKRNMMGKMVDTYNLKDGLYSYSWTSGSKTGTKVKIDRQQIGQLNYNDITEEQKSTFNIQEAGTEEFLFKPCKVYTLSYQGANSKNWVWEGITLKTETSIEKDINAVEMIGTKITSGAVAPAGVFEIPRDIDFKEKN